MAYEVPSSDEEVCLFLEGGKLPKKPIEGAIDYTLKLERAVMTIAYSDKARMLENMKRRGVTVVTVRRHTKHASACRAWLDTSRARIARLHNEYVRNAAKIREEDRSEAVAVYLLLQEQEKELIEKQRKQLEEHHLAQTRAVENLVRIFGRGPFHIEENLYDPFQTRTGRLILKRRAARAT